jgi:hypothetical protein
MASDVAALTASINQITGRHDSEFERSMLAIRTSLNAYARVSAPMRSFQQDIAALTAPLASTLNMLDLTAPIRSAMEPVLRAQEIQIDSGLGASVLAAMKPLRVPTQTWASTIANFSQSDIMPGLEAHLATVAGDSWKHAVRDVRMTSLLEGFRYPTPGLVGALGDLGRIIDVNPQLSAATTDVLTAAVSSGGFGFDFRGVQDGAERLADALERDPDLELQVREAVTDVAPPEDELLEDFGEVLGLVDRIRKHRFSTIGAIFGLSAGLARFVAGGPIGPQTPTVVYEAVSSGAAIYFFVHQSTKDRP